MNQNNLQQSFKENIEPQYYNNFNPNQQQKYQQVYNNQPHKNNQTENQKIQQLENHMQNILQSISVKMSKFMNLNEMNQQKFQIVQEKHVFYNEQRMELQSLQEENMHLKQTVEEQKIQLDDLRANQKNFQEDNIWSTIKSEFSSNLISKGEMLKNRIQNIRNEYQNDFKLHQHLQNIEDLYINSQQMSLRYIEQQQQQQQPLTKKSSKNNSLSTTNETNKVSECPSHHDPNDSYYLSHDPPLPHLEQQLIQLNNSASPSPLIPLILQQVHAIYNQIPILKQSLQSSEQEIQRLEGQAQQNTLYIQKQQGQIQKAKAQVTALTQENTLLQNQVNHILTNFVHNQNQ